MPRPATVLVAYAAEAGLPTADASAADVLSVAEDVSAALAAAGFAPSPFPVVADLAAVRRRLAADRPALVFNLVEGLAGADAAAPAFPLLLEAMGLPFTGCGAAATALSNDKLLSKRFLAAGGGNAIPPAAWLAPGRQQPGLAFFNPSSAGGGAASFLPTDVVIKPVSEHASLHMSAASVLRRAGGREVAAALRAAEERHNKPFFAEMFLPGREFSVSLFTDALGAVSAFPPAEIVFAAAAGAAAPPVVDYAAKWLPGSPEYAATPVRFLAGEPELAAGLVRAAVAAAAALGLSWRAGAYLRVDMRSDSAGVPHVLEANANPCLSPGSGYARAAAETGLDYPRLVHALARAALRSSSL